MSNEIILFDINETVLNLSDLKPAFTDAFGSDEALPLWFSSLLHASTVCISTRVKTNFLQLSEAMLDSLSARYAIKLSSENKTKLLNSFANLQPHPDIIPALKKLRSNGFRTIAFSNSSQHLIASQIKNSGLANYFDDIISVEETGSFKPDINVYKFAAKKLNQPVGSLRLVATHDWDTHGALCAGLNAAYIDRSNTPYNPYYHRPDIFDTTMEGIADQIIKHSSEESL